MDKKFINNIVAIINLFLGICYIFAPLIPILFTLPKVDQFYSSFGDPNIVKPSFVTTYIFLGIIILMGVVNLLFGFKGLQDKSKTKRYLRYGIICALVTFILGGVFAALALMPITSSIYNTASQF